MNEKFGLVCGLQGLVSGSELCTGQQVAIGAFRIGQIQDKPTNGVNPHI